MALLIIGLVTSALLTWAVRKYALKNAILDIPNNRSSHTVSTPRGGGLAIVIVFLLSTTYISINYSTSQDAFLGLFVSSLLVAAIGFWDDHHSLGRKWRITVHLFAAIWVFYWAGGLGPIPFWGNEVSLGLLGNIIGVIALVWLLNLYNFMDGIDGIAAIEAITVAGFAAVILYFNGEHLFSFWMAILVAACLGFLIWNWPPAKIFMGDVGSGFLGITLGGFALITSNYSILTVWTWLILLGVFLIDSTITLLTRILRGVKWYEAHRSHAYQHVAGRLRSHKKVTIVVFLINFIWLFPWAWISTKVPKYGIAFVIITYIPLVIAALLLGAGKETSWSLVRREDSSSSV